MAGPEQGGMTPEQEKQLKVALGLPENTDSQKNIADTAGNRLNGSPIFQKANDGDYSNAFPGGNRNEIRTGGTKPIEGPKNNEVAISQLENLLNKMSTVAKNNISPSDLMTFNTIRMPDATAIKIHPVVASKLSIPMEGTIARFGAIKIALIPLMQAKGMRV
ncbi:MAG: hypothetical protein Q8K26_04225 [Candidatus Gracilibacteria bacterium]|nr:hypothetical protein [Candidatus Gracilibacteria bacterium]